MMAKKIAFGDNFKRFSQWQWYRKCFTCAPQGHTFLYHKKNAYLILFFVIAGMVFFRQGRAAEPVPQANPLRPDKIEYKADGLDDPFGGQEVEEPVKEEKVEMKPLPQLTIQGLIWGGHFPQAIVNNKVWRVGDTVEEARIVDINKEGLVIDFQGQQYNITSPGVRSSKLVQSKLEGGIDEK
jgi:hypothetical protein